MGEVVQYYLHNNEYSIICLNRPNKRNAISEKMVEELNRYVVRARQDSIKCLLITGADPMFCAGGDLNDLHGDMTADEAFATLYPMKEVLYNIAAFPVPTICLLNGDALGGGCELATACDFRLAKEGTRFGFIQSRLGIVPGWGGGTLLYEKVQPDFAYEWLIRAETYDASFLYERGWIHQIIPYEQWDNIDTYLQPYLAISYEQAQHFKQQYQKRISIQTLSAQMDDEVRQCAQLWGREQHKAYIHKTLRK